MNRPLFVAALVLASLASSPSALAWGHHRYGSSFSWEHQGYRYLHSFASGWSRSRWSSRTSEADCSGVTPGAATPLGRARSLTWAHCGFRRSNGFLLPDSSCTPGAVNPTVTLDVLKGSRFRTACVRHTPTAGMEVRGWQERIYQAYGVRHPWNNVGPNQTCELDHLVPLELGGANTISNLWPECGPAGAALSDREFKRKDTVENYLAFEVKAGRMRLGDAQRGIATDWTQYLPAAQATCPGGRCPYSSSYARRY